MMLLLLFSFSLYANICTDWQKPVELGLLPHKHISESSGVQVSKKIKDRLYHINDSGDGPFFYITDFSGKNLKTVKVEDFYPVDVEDITLASYGGKDYIVIADIGDNMHARNSVQLFFIEETENFPAAVKPSHIVDVTYPEGRKENIEGFSFHPNGDFYLFSKEEDIDKGKAFPFIIYKLSKDIFLKKQKQAIAQEVTTVDLPKLLPNDGWLGQIVTAIDIDTNGNWLLLTYKKAIYSSLDLTKPIPAVKDWKEGVDFVTITLLDYPQQEAISFIPGTESFLITTEYKKKYKKAPISEVRCRLSKK